MYLFFRTCMVVGGKESIQLCIILMYCSHMKSKSKVLLFIAAVIFMSSYKFVKKNKCKSQGVFKEQHIWSGGEI